MATPAVEPPDWGEPYSHRRSVMRLALTLALLATLSGCSSSGTPSPDGAAPAADAPDLPGPTEVELRVVNVSGNTVSAFVLWRGANRVRLGDVSTGRTRVFRTPFRGTEVAIIVDDTNAPPVGTQGLGTGVPGQNTYASVE